MGNKKDPMTVVDSECKVRFVERLRVADSSIFPSITNRNLNSPTIMVSEKNQTMFLDVECFHHLTLKSLFIPNGKIDRDKAHPNNTFNVIEPLII